MKKTNFQIKVEKCLDRGKEKGAFAPFFIIDHQLLNRFLLRVHGHQSL